MDASSSPFALEFATAASFLLFAGAFWIVSSLGQWAIAPVERFTPSTTLARVRTQFSLRELMLLGVQVQLAAGAGLWLSASDARWAASACTLAVCGVTAIWLTSLRRLAHCRVNCSRRRAAFLAIVAPLTCVAIALGLWFNGRAVVETISTGDFALAPWLAGNFVGLCAFVLCRRLTLWVLGSAASVAAVPVAAEPCRS
jgi:hypothetical protein